MPSRPPRSHQQEPALAPAPASCEPSARGLRHRASASRSTLDRRRRAADAPHRRRSSTAESDALVAAKQHARQKAHLPYPHDGASACTEEVPKGEDREEIQKPVSGAAILAALSSRGYPEVCLACRHRLVVAHGFSSACPPVAAGSLGLFLTLYLDALLPLLTFLFTDPRLHLTVLFFTAGLAGGPVCGATLPSPENVALAGAPKLSGCSVAAPLHDSVVVHGGNATGDTGHGAALAHTCAS